MIAALDSAGNATAWNPNANGGVTALAVSGTTVYVGGAFTTIGGQTRSRIAALDAATGNATEWNPGADNTVNCLAVSGTTAYTGGNFANAGQGNSHPYFAQFGGSGSTSVSQPVIHSSVSGNTAIHDAHLSISGLRVTYRLFKSERVYLRLYDLKGRLHAVFVNKRQAEGSYTVNLRSKSPAAGAYVVVLRTGEYCEKKLVSITK
jgi:hypothetical protein